MPIVIKIQVLGTLEYIYVVFGMFAIVFILFKLPWLKNP